jgi:hypothetical protein
MRDIEPNGALYRNLALITENLKVSGNYTIIFLECHLTYLPVCCNYMTTEGAGYL